MLKPLLKSGYFPQELPPLFSTAQFTACISKTNSTNLPKGFTNKKADWTSPSHHNLARVGGLRRRLSVPNPVNFYRVAKVFSSNASKLKDEWGKSPFSYTTPALTTLGARALSPTNSDRATPRALIRVGAKYILRADISQFYPSIYTHTIPWVLHTKKTAKANINNMSLFGNVLDKELQACQYGQTKGIAIGPDTSLGVAELLLSNIDYQLNKDCKIIGGVRFIDDMEFSFQHLADAEHTMARLEALLYEHELQLNIQKTKIFELPDSFESPYVTELRLYLPAKDKATRAEWVDFFNKAFHLAKIYPADGVLRYAVSSLRKIKISANHWPLVQNLLWQCISSDPGTIRFVIDTLLSNTRSNKNLTIDDSLAESALDSLITNSAPVGHGSEVVWSIWAALLFKLKLSDECQSTITKMDDSFVAVIAFLANSHGVFKSPLTSDLWAEWFEEGCFNENHWLFVYEAFRHNWMTSEVKHAKLKSNPYCKFMGQNNVSFVNEKLIASYKPSVFTIENFFLSGAYG